jgi:Fe-S oxidoreductase
MIKVTRKAIKDPGIDEPVKNLNPEKIEKAIKWVLEKETAARLKAYLETCIHCGLCSEACHYYLSHDRDPSYAPVGKVRQTLWEMLKRKGRVDKESMRRFARIAYTECNLCRRCSMYCPFGIDIAYLISLVRRICTLLKVVPQYLQARINSQLATMNSEWISQDDWIDTVQWQEEELRLDIKNARIPLDKEGAEIMYSLHSVEVKFMTSLVANMAKIMTVAGIDWTLPSRDGWDNTNQAMHGGDYETMGMSVRNHFEAALKLKVKKIVMNECGHAFKAVAYDGTRWLGWKNPPVPYIHAVQFYYELIRDGKIKIAKKIEEPVTVQDPCNIVRGRGLGDIIRSVVRATCKDFRDMTPRYEHNYCCCSGGGVLHCDQPWKSVRMEGNRIKAEQLRDTEAKLVITTCHSCHKGIHDLIDYYKLGMNVKFLSEILVEVMEISEELKVG